MKYNLLYTGLWGLRPYQVIELWGIKEAECKISNRGLSKEKVSSNHMQQKQHESWPLLQKKDIPRQGPHCVLRYTYLPQRGLRKCLKVNSVAHSDWRYRANSILSPTPRSSWYSELRKIFWRRIIMLRLLPLLSLAVSLPSDKTTVSWICELFFLFLLVILCFTCYISIEIMDTHLMVQIEIVHDIRGKN